MPFPFNKKKKAVEKKRSKGGGKKFMTPAEDAKYDEKSGKKEAKPGDFFAKMRSSK